MRFPLGILSQYIGRKRAAIVEMSAIVIALVYGFLFVKSYNDVLAMGVFLGIAGASFGVALSLGSGWHRIPRFTHAVVADSICAFATWLPGKDVPPPQANSCAARFLM
jgi:hypothetical protein